MNSSGFVFHRFEDILFVELYICERAQSVGCLIVRLWGAGNGLAAGASYFSPS